MNDITIALPALAKQINTEHEATEKHAKSAIDHALRAGELLIQAKGEVEHGRWLLFHLSKNFTHRTSPAAN